jgi:hypothetical protein
MDTATFEHWYKDASTKQSKPYQSFVNNEIESK